MRHVDSLGRFIPVLAASAVLAACGGSGDGGNDPPSQSQMGTLKLNISDAPMDSAQEIWVQFRAVEFKPEGGAPIMHELKNDQGATTPRRINLLPLQDGRTAILVDSIQVPAGRYEWVRLIVDNEPNVRDSYMVMNGNECELRIPSGSESGLKMIHGFTLPAEGSVALTADFDLRKSIHAPPGQQGSGMNCTQAYMMKPVLRLVEDSNSGAITGTVNPTLFTDPTLNPDPSKTCTRMVYVFPDGQNAAGSATPDDYDGKDAEPVQMVKADMVNGNYRVSFLPAGNYTLAFTCGEDVAEQDDTLVFSAKASAVVQPGLITSGINFPVPAP
jgi:hypothetical protein